jgi:hypothetical protein
MVEFSVWFCGAFYVVVCVCVCVIEVLPGWWRTLGRYGSILHCLLWISTNMMLMAQLLAPNLRVLEMLVLFCITPIPLSSAILMCTRPHSWVF